MLSSSELKRKFWSVARSSLDNTYAWTSKMLFNAMRAVEKQRIKATGIEKFHDQGPQGFGWNESELFRFTGFTCTHRNEEVKATFEFIGIPGRERIFAASFDEHGKIHIGPIFLTTKQLHARRAELMENGVNPDLCDAALAVMTPDPECNMKHGPGH